MDKALRALELAEKNAVEIAALRNRANAGKSDADKASQALELAENSAAKASQAFELAKKNAADIAALRNRKSVVVAKGTKSGGITSFGTVPAGVAIVGFDGDACALLSGGKIVSGGSAPIIATVEAGTLVLSAERNNAAAAILV